MSLQPSSSRRRRGAALIEYGLLIAGVALMAAAAVSVFGHKTNDLISATASVLPGAHPGDNAPLRSGKLIETTEADTGVLQIDADEILNNTDTARLENNFGVTGFNEGLVVEPGS